MKCYVPGCDQPIFVKGRGWCRSHYERWRRYGSPIAGRVVGEPAQWLVEKASVTHPESCVDWPFGLSSPGYGALAWEGSSDLAHRVMLELVHPWHPPLGRNALHHCDRRICVNPRHLFWGTHKRNALDAAERSGMGRGENSPTAKLTTNQVVEIRARHAAGGVTYREMAKDYGVHETAISQVVRRVTWQHVP